MLPNLKQKAHQSIFVLCVLAFIFNLHYALPAYLHSSYLSQWVDSSMVGIIFTMGSLVMIVTFSLMAPVLRKFGNFRVTLTLLLLEFIALLGLAYAPNSWVAISSFVLSFVSAGIIWFTFDIFLEHFSLDKITGNIRGSYLTIGNLAWVIGPITAAFILGDGGFTKMFLVSAALLIPVTFLLKHNLSNFEDPEYKRSMFLGSIKEMWHEKNVRYIFSASVLLQFFYAWMVIYIPIYLHEHVGFEWTTIGAIFSFMLLPFVMVGVPLGKIADKLFGEKEIMSLGFIIMAVFTAIIFLLDTTNPFIWAAILFMTRIGAASVEVMIDTYFFKKVTSARVNIISLFRTTRPFAYIIAPIVATIFLIFVEMKSLFLILGFLMFYGLRYSLAIKDTK